jgi:hypothetical protein
MKNKTNQMITLRISGQGAELVCGKLNAKQSNAWKQITDNGSEFDKLIDHVRNGEEDMVDSDSFLGEWSDLSGVYHIHGCNMEDGILIVELNGKELFKTDISELDNSIDTYYTWDELAKGAYFTATSEESGLFFEAVLPISNPDDFDPELLTCQFSDVFGREILTKIFYDDEPLENTAIADQTSVSFDAQINWI